MKAVINFYIYSAIHIALCAAAMTWSSYRILDLAPNWYYIAFVGFGTWLLYSVHKLIGQQTIYLNFTENRFSIIGNLKTPLIICSSIAAIASTYLILRLERSYIQALSIPCLMAAMYILPMFYQKKRLRDYHYIKIFLVAACWAWLCALIPNIDSNLCTVQKLFFGLEKAIFIFAITLPFDYRDIDVDKETSVKTIAHLLGNKIKLAVSISFLCCVLCCFTNSYYSLNVKCILAGIYILLWGITYFALGKKHDYYYSGLIDGTILLFAILIGILF